MEDYGVNSESSCITRGQGAACRGKGKKKPKRNLGERREN